ncbi:MAG: N-6 DNA methylase [Flavobacteriales bacterium]|jgi:type I restriction enzyme M protein
MMKEFKIAEILPVEGLKANIWPIFDILKSEGISSEDYHVLLFLLSVYKDGVISTEELNRNERSIVKLIHRFRSSNTELANQYLEILPSFERILLEISESGTERIISALGKLDKVTLNRHFADVFDAILYRITEAQGRFGGEFIQPIELTRFICGLAELKSNSKVYNPFAGLASFGVFLDHGHNYFGQESNQKTWALGALRLMAYQRPGASIYVSEDSINQWPNSSEKFDLIVSNPPYGMRLGSQYREIEPEFRTTEQFLLEKGVQSLSDKGKLISVLPQGVLFRGFHEQRLREFLINEDLIDSIISLPGGLLQSTSIPLIIMVLNKDKSTPGMVRFVDAKRFIETKTSSEKVLNDYRLNGYIHGIKTDLDVVRFVSNDQIKAFDYNLSVPRYFQKKIEGVKLSEIIEFVRGKRTNLPPTGKLIRIRDLKDDKVDFRLDEASIEDVELRRSDIHQITESCLLLAVRWKTLKPTLFEFKGEPIYRGQDILSFKVNEAIADEAFLINELHADYVQEQLESFRLGASVIPFLRRDDLMEVVIKLPSLQEQRAKVQGILELSDKIKILQAERNALAHGVSSKLYESVSTIKHSLGKPLLNIGSSLRNIEKALSRINVGWEHFKLNERYDLSIKDSFESIYINLELIHSLLRNNESVLDLSRYDLVEMDFLTFIKGYVKRIKSAERANVNTILEIHPDIKIYSKNEVLIKGNSELLEIALNNIVENANMHAFTDDSIKYKLEFRISLIVAPRAMKLAEDTIGTFDTYIKVVVANNGKPFPKNYELDKLIRKNSFAGETGNTGQGGFDLNEIIKYHNNGNSTLELINADFSTEFVTTYSFLIPFNR